MRRVLEIGIGGGNYHVRPIAPCLPSWYCVYCDKVPSSDLGVVYCDVEGGLDFHDESFDEVYMSHVLEHLRDPLSALKEVYRVLKPGGRLHVIVPNALSRNARADPDHKHFFTYMSLKKLLLRTGFKIVKPDRYNLIWPLRIAKPLLMILADEIYLIGVKELK